MGGWVHKLTISLISVWVERFEESKTALSLDACRTELGKGPEREGGREGDEQMGTGTVKRKEKKMNP